jgi:hypothetical protein
MPDAKTSRFGGSVGDEEKSLFSRLTPGRGVADDGVRRADVGAIKRFSSSLE